MNKTYAYLLTALVLLAPAALISCGSSGDGSSASHGLRTLSRVVTDFHMTGAQEAADNGSAAQDIYSFEYGPGAHLFWTRAEVENGLGQNVRTAAQALDDQGFPVRAVWYGPEGRFNNAYDYAYDHELYLQTSATCFRDEPSTTENPRKEFEQENTWSEEGVLLTRTRRDYDQGGELISEYKWRSVTAANSLRGAAGVGYYEYYREYDDGELTYQDATEFDADGYPRLMTIDHDGDHIPETTYYGAVTRTDQGYLDTLTWRDQASGANVSRDVFGYGQNGLVASVSGYQWRDGEFVLSSTTADVWYPNPVNGPAGALKVAYPVDRQGYPVEDYSTVRWTETSMVRRYYHQPDEEFKRITEILEKIELP